MLVKANEVADLLAVDEKAVLKWIKKEGLPATLVNGTYRINRVDLLEWATDHSIMVPPELFTIAESDIHYPTLAEALEAGGIHYSVPGIDKLSVLTNVVNWIKLPPQMDPDFLLQVLLAREALGTTAIGNGIAIPHVRNPILLNRPSPAISRGCWRLTMRSSSLRWDVGVRPIPRSSPFRRRSLRSSSSLARADTPRRITSRRRRSSE